MPPGRPWYSTSAALDLSDSSLPPGIPAALFQSERYDNGEAGEMTWSFPVSPGTYEVRLYFAEIWFTTPNSRIFGVSIEGSPVLTGYDIVADVGSMKGVAKSFVVASDSTLDVQFNRIVENPKVSAIEILEVTPQPAQAGVFPAALDFGTVTLGQTSTKLLQVTNLGASGDPAINVSQTTIFDAGASQFSDNFSDGTGVSLAPGQSTTIAVTFAPSLMGAQDGTLAITHSGINSPLAVALHGSGSSTSTASWQTLAPAGTSRHETTYVHHAGKFYLNGDRGYLLNEVYDAATNSWSTTTPLPEEFHHAQGVVLNGFIYYLGGLAGPYPDHVVPGVHIFSPGTGTWTTGTPMPAARARGGGGTALYNGKLYVAGGLQDTTSSTGHEGVSVNLFDVYDPQTGTWTALPNMPRPRYYFHAAVVGNKFYAMAGRQGAIPDFFNAVSRRSTSTT